MQPFARPSLIERFMAWGPFVASAALVALGVHLAARSPELALVFAGLAALAFVPQLRARRRVRRLLESGDVEAVLDAWQAALEQLPERATMAPLIAATALVSNGMVERARTALSRAQRGPAWEAALEHRLFVEVLADAFEGDPRACPAERRATGPPPPATRKPIRTLPRLAAPICGGRPGPRVRALAPTRRSGHPALRRTPEPTGAWAMRYAAAVDCIDSGKQSDAQKLLEGAPEWPEASAFQAFHSELSAHASVPGARLGERAGEPCLGGWLSR